MTRHYLPIVLALACLIGCSTVVPKPPKPDPNGVPNLALVDKPGIYRGGQPTPGGWAYLHSIGVSNIIKLNTDYEGTDAVGYNTFKMECSAFPIDTAAQLFPGVINSVDVSNAVALVRPGTIIHCEHGEDRTGLIVGLHRLLQGTNKAAAYNEMLQHGFHPALKGLQSYWEKQSQPYP